MNLDPNRFLKALLILLVFSLSACKSTPDSMPSDLPPEAGKALIYDLILGSRYQILGANRKPVVRVQLNDGKNRLPCVALEEGAHILTLREVKIIKSGESVEYDEDTNNSEFDLHVEVVGGKAYKISALGNSLLPMDE